MHLKLKVNKKDSLVDSGQKRTNRKSQNMASSLVNDDEDNATSTTRNTQQQQQQQNNNSSNNNSANCLNQQNNNTTTKMHGNEAKLKKENLQQRKQELEKLLGEKSWLLQQLQKQETEILNGNFEYMNFNEFISNLAVQYKQEQGTDSGSTAGGVSQFSANEEAILRRKPLTAKENHQQLQHNVLHRRQSEISNRSSEYDNYPHHDTLSTHSDGGTSSVAGRGGGAGTMTMHQAQQAQQQYNAKSALKKRSATVAGTTQQHAVANLQMLRHQQQQQQHLEQQMQQQQHAIYKQHHYHHPQQHLFKQHVEHHQVLMPHLQYATQKFYYTTLQPQTQSQNPQQQQPQYGRYIKTQTLQQHAAQQSHQQSPQQQQQQQLIHVPQNAQQQSPNRNQQQHIIYTSNQLPAQQQHLLLTPPHASSSAAAANIDNISLYSLNSNNVATLHRQAQQQLPIIVQCDKYYLSPTTHHVSHNDGGGFIKSSQNIKEYISPLNSPQHQGVVMTRDRKLASQTNLSNRGVTNTPSIDAISLAPSYVSMETVEYMTSPTTSQQQQQQQHQHHPSNMRWRSQTNLPPTSSSTTMTGEMKSHSSDMLNNNHYYHTPVSGASQPPPQVTQVKPFKPLDEISINSYSSDTQKKTKSKQWMESSLDGPVIRQTPQHMDNNDNVSQQHTQRSKLSSHSLNTSRHYSMSAAQAKPANTCINNNGAGTKLSQSTSYLNQLEATQTPVSSISQAYNIETTSPQSSTTQLYKHLPSQQGGSSKPPPRPPLYINAGSSGSAAAQQLYQTINVSPTAGVGGALSIATSPAMVGMSSSSPLSPDIRIESPKNMTVVQPATFQPYKEVTKPFEMSDFYKYSTKYRQKENNNNGNGTQPEN